MLIDAKHISKWFTVGISFSFHNTVKEDAIIIFIFLDRETETQRGYEMDPILQR